MATYKLNITLTDHTTYTVNTSDQPEDITAFMNKMLKSDWNTFTNRDGSITAIHMPLASSVVITKI